MRLENGRTAAVVRIEQLPGTQSVYNLEVDGEHVYHVGLHGVLVHNTCGVLLGRDMPNRVLPVADVKGLKTYLPNWKKRGETLREGTKEWDNAVKANAQWIRDQVNAGRTIQDIGGDVGAIKAGAGASDFYDAEKAVLRGLGFERKLVGSVKLDGQTFPLFEWIKR